MRNVLFYERQSTNRVVFVLALLIGLLGLVALLPSSGGEQALAPGRGLAGFVMLALAVIVLNRVTITTWVYEDSVRVQQGRVFPWRNTHIKLAAIESMSAQESGAIPDVGNTAADAEGFEDGTPVVMNTDASHVVHIRTGTRSYLIGTRHPEKLLECIRTAQENSGSADRED